jgi:hypothetical protein
MPLGHGVRHIPRSRQAFDAEPDDPANEEASMFERLKVGAWACVGDCCPIRTMMHPEIDAVTIVFGEHDAFELLVTTSALRNLAQLTANTLDQVTSATEGSEP